MQPKGGPRLLVTDREGALFLERARIHVEGGRVVYHIADDEMRREYNIPHVNLAVLFMGQGTSITQEAARLLAEEGVHVALTGTGGTPVHFGSLTHYSSTRHFRDLLPIYLDPSLSLVGAKTIMLDRIERMKKVGVALSQRHLSLRDPQLILSVCRTFEANLAKATSIDMLLGFEGNFTKACYKIFADISGLSKTAEFRREAGAGEPAKRGMSPLQIANSLIDHGNYLAYGMAGAALWALGVPPHLSLFHGKTRAGGLVFDLADAFKDAFVLPIAFAVARSTKEEEPADSFRGKLISAFNDRQVLAEAIATVERVIESGAKARQSADA